MHKKAQMSVEYMILTGFLLLILIVPGLYILYSYGNSSVYSSINQQTAADLGNGIADSVRQLYYLGIYSKKTVVYEIPQNVEYMFVLKTVSSAAPPVTTYSLGLFVNENGKLVKQFFTIEAPAYVNASSVDLTTISTIKALMPECASGACPVIEPFKKPVTKPGKREFHFETLSQAGTTAVQITPIS